jgi:hypothetical protein
MHSLVDTNDPAAVQADVQRAFKLIFPGADTEFIPRAFDWVIGCFNGKHKDYEAIDAPYHDLEHTLQGTACLMQLLLGLGRAGTEPRLTARTFELGLLAVLLHDSGYLKMRGDTEGTGAKYTFSHVVRSTQIAGRLLIEKGYREQDVQAVQNMIRCTGLKADLASIPFQHPSERITGLALASADLIGQMAADDYPEKLPLLFAEFQEASRYPHDPSRSMPPFENASDLVHRTPAFWRDVVKPQLDGELEGLYRFLNDPYPSGPNEYLDRIQANLRRMSSTA